MITIEEFKAKQATSFVNTTFRYKISKRDAQGVKSSWVQIVSEGSNEFVFP